MKKAELKRLKKFIEPLSDIPIIEDGGTKYTQVIRIGLNVKLPEKGNFVNKVKFFTEFMKQGKTAQQAVDAWNEKFKKVQEQILILAEERKNNPPPKKTTEQIKQEVADKEQKRMNKQGHN
jgi:seryl-tRNA synthetase